MMSDFQEDIRKLNELIVALINQKRKLIPKYIKVNKNYLEKLLNSENVTEFNFNSNGDMWIDYDTQGYFGTFTSIPLIIDNTIETFAFVYENGRIVNGTL